MITHLHRFLLGGAVGIVFLLLAGNSQAQMGARYFYGSLPWTAEARFLQGAPYAPLFPYDLLAGYPYGNLSASQPIGHEILPLGPNGYVYRPIYPNPPATAATLTPSRPAMPQGAAAIYPPEPNGFGRPAAQGAVPPTAVPQPVPQGQPAAKPQPMIPRELPAPAPQGGPREF